ncbi:hypothetical protein MBANPS3_010632 [Mucor bainieri]
MDSDSSPPSNNMNDIKPDINDPNNYCRACDRKHSAKPFHSIGKMDQEVQQSKTSNRVYAKTINEKSTIPNHADRTRFQLIIALNINK